MFRLIAVFAVLFIVACAPSGQTVRDPDKVNEVLITFITKAQAGYWDDAMENITYEERMAMMDGDLVKPEYMVGIKRIRLSAVNNNPYVLDGKGRLVGIKEMLDASNLRYTISDEQRAVNLDGLDKARTERINLMREKGKEILEEQEREQEQENDVIYTNKLSSTERQKALDGEHLSTKADVVNADEWVETAEEPVNDDNNSAESTDNVESNSDDASSGSSADETGSGWR